MELGGIDFMNKPFNPRELMAVLDRVTAAPRPEGGPAPVGATPHGPWSPSIGRSARP